MKLGIYSFGDNTINPLSNKQISPENRMQNLIEEIKLADDVGLDIFGIGEHHREEYIISSPIVPLAAAAAVTKNIILTSAVTVLSSDDPIRAFQQFSELDLISGGRAEIMVGRGSFIESFPLFGYDLKDYEELFEEKLEMLLKINENENLTWEGKFTQKVNDKKVLPRPTNSNLPIWIASGGSPGSVARAARLGLPLALAIIGGQPAQFKPVIDFYWQKIKEYGHDPESVEVSINSHGFIADDSKEALDMYFPYYEHIMNILGNERGWPPVTRNKYEIETSPAGALLVGSPEEIVEKILFEHGLFNNSRFLLQISIASMEHKDIMKSIELFGTKVAPIVRKELGS